jgi:hypothetical protein
MSPPLVGGDEGEGGKKMIHPHPAPPPSMGRGIKGGVNYGLSLFSRMYPLYQGEEF